MTQETPDVDTFMKSGRIGPSMLQSINSGHSTALTLNEVTFTARRNPDGYAELVMTVPGGREFTYRVVQLHTILRGPDYLSDQEVAFFHSLGLYGQS